MLRQVETLQQLLGEKRAAYEGVRPTPANQEIANLKEEIRLVRVASAIRLISAIQAPPNAAVAALHPSTIWLPVSCFETRLAVHFRMGTPAPR